MTTDFNITLLKEILFRVDKISNQEFEQIQTQIYEVLASEEMKARNVDKQQKEMYIDIMVDTYLETFSERVFRILVGISYPYDEYLFNVLTKKLNVHPNVQKRFSVLILLSNIVHRVPTWLPKIVNFPLLDNFFTILKTEHEIVLLATSALILVELIATLPSVISQCLDEIFNCFKRLTIILYKKSIMNEKNDIFFLLLNSIVYRLCLRLYAMYPCNFFNFLKLTYGSSNKDFTTIFTRILGPMLSRIRFHPLLILSSNEQECDKSRWFYKEPHDILNECGQLAIDPIEFRHVAEIYEHFSTFVDEHDELGNLDDSFSDDDNKVIDNIIKPEMNLQYGDSRNVIFAKLSEEIKNQEPLTSLLDVLGKMGETGSSNEFVQEAIMMGEEMSSNMAQNDTQNLVVPVAISADQKQISSLIQQKRTPSKVVCFSPFKPIKEGNSMQAGENMSPLITATIDTTEVDHFGNENEEVDYEIVQTLSQENKLTSDLSVKEDTSPHIVKPNPESYVTSLETTKSNPIQKLDVKDQVLVGSINQSLQMANKRMRFATTGCFDDIFLSETCTLHNSRSKSCPMLYFALHDSDNVTANDLEERGSQVGDNENLSVDTNETNSNASESRASDKPRVNLMLNNPNSEMKRRIMKVKTCKSVDITKEAKAKCREMRERHVCFCKCLSFLQNPATKMFPSSSSIESNNRLKFDTSSPHQNLDRMLLMISEICMKQLGEKSGTNADKSGESSRRDSILNTISSASSIEHIPAYFSSTEDDMKKFLAIMYAQLVFERHQRDSHVTRNRRLYKKTKECIELEEKLIYLRDQLSMQEKEIEHLRARYNDSNVAFKQERQTLQQHVDLLANKLKQSQEDYRLLQTEKCTQEASYRSEIKSLNKTYRNIEMDLNKYICNFDKNTDFARLQKENVELKKQIFLFGEFYGKIRELYFRNKKVDSDLNEKLLFDSLQFENKELKEKLHNTNSQLKMYTDRCSKLESQLKQEDVKCRSKLETEEINFLQASLKEKDKQIEALKAILVNYENHIKKLDGELLAKSHSELR